MAKNGKLNPVDANMEYWNKLVTREEFQQIIDEQDQAIAAKLAEMEMIITFLLARLQVPPEEFGQWIKARVAKLTKRRAAYLLLTSPASSRGSNNAPLLHTAQTTDPDGAPGNDVVQISW